MKPPTKTTPDAFSVSQLSVAFDCDRRTVGLAIREVKPAAVTGTGKRYRLRDAACALERYRAGRNSPRISAMRFRQIELRNQKLEHQIAILKRDYVPAVDVEKWGAEIGAAVRKVVSQIHRIAPSVVGLSVPEAEAMLRDIESEILETVDVLKSPQRA
ncbi:MAG: hypothetical protein AB7J34_24945 [Limisphaerales bacterium]